MKKMFAMLVALVLLMTAAFPAFAAGYTGSNLNFTQRDFFGGQTLPVYHGPGVEYQRGANGWAKCSTDDVVYAAGMENGWALVMYYTSGGSVRVGYVDMDQFKYDTKILKLDEIQFEYREAIMDRECMMTDDPALYDRDLGYVGVGSTVTYLGSFYMHRRWAYIETWSEDNNHPIRGFVPMEFVILK